jgi:hypothetical protein
MEGFSRTILLTALAIVVTATPLFAEDLPPEPASTTAGTPPSTEPQFEHGQPHKVIDAVGWVFGIPEKIILWDRRAANHSISPETEQSVAQYLSANGMESTKVRVNQYDPLGEWQRLTTNQRVGAGWRYTLGAFDTLGYTLLPGRLFGSDGYNPYTDSVYIYSDIPCLGQEQASFAKLVHERPHPGTYAAVTSLPVVRLWPEKVSKDDVLDFTLAEGTPAEQNEAIHILYPEFGAEVGGQIGLFAPTEIPLSLVGAGVGHVAAHFDADASPPQPAPTITPLPPVKSAEIVPASFTK